MKRSKLTTGIAALPPFTVLIAGLVSPPCWAHPGHGLGGGDWTLFHYLTEPEHVVPALVLALLVVAPLVVRAIRARKSRQKR